MKKLDIYLIAKYLKSFFFTSLLFSLIAIVIDFSEKVNKFLSGKVSTQEIIFDYYINYLPDINAILWPLFALISVIFFSSRMAKNSEFIAILSGGVSFARLARPFLISAAVIAVILAVSNHFIIPITNQTKLDFMDKYIEKPTRNDKGRNRHLFISPETKLFVRYYNNYDSAATDARFETYRDHKIVRIVKAQKMEFVSQPNLWKLRRIETRTFNELTETFDQNYSLEIDTTLNVFPEDFITMRNDEKRMTSPEILTYMQRERQRGSSNLKKFQIELQRRSADPVSIFILTLIGIAVATRKVRGGIGLHLALGVGIGAIFIFLSRFSATFALNPNISPALAVWTPNIIFTIICAWMVSRAQK